MLDNPTTVGERIAAALERIASALEEANKPIIGPIPDVWKEMLDRHLRIPGGRIDEKS